MLRLININNKAIPEVKVFLNKKFIGYASMYEFGYIGGSEEVMDLPQHYLNKIQLRLSKIWVVRH